jgi:hypothetical protein
MDATEAAKEPAEERGIVLSEIRSRRRGASPQRRTLRLGKRSERSTKRKIRIRSEC